MTAKIQSTEEAADIIRHGGLVAFPTETVFGLGVDATNAEAVERLFAAKGRPSDNPLIVHLADRHDWKIAAAELTSHAEALLEVFTPGPLTVVLPKRDEINSMVTAGLDSVGIRVPDHASAQEILRQAGVPVAAPSANRSGRPSSTTWRAVLEDLEGRIDAVYCEDTTRIGIESTVVDCCGDRPQILRPGAVTLQQLQAVVSNTEGRTEHSTGEDQRARQRVKSPGLLHAHYQPVAKICLIEQPSSHTIQLEKGIAYCGLIDFEGRQHLDFS
ncbi:MAG: L-threonylcarbamoyladenylate synthase, partial [Planctomycetota bacterium]